MLAPRVDLRTEAAASLVIPKRPRGHVIVYLKSPPHLLWPLQAHFRDFIGLHKPFIEDGYMPTREEVIWMSEGATNTGSLMTHFALFLPTILGQASPEQVMRWLPKTLNFQMVGSYAQTELGHGSNVRGLQTVATYDKATEVRRRDSYRVHTSWEDMHSWRPVIIGLVWLYSQF